MFTTENIKVGDLVIVNYFHIVNALSFVGEVVKKTPSGLIDVRFNGTTLRFNQTGRVYNRPGKYQTSSYSLVYYSDELAVAIQLSKDKQRKINAIKNYDFSNVSLETLNKICELLILV